jgi:hypothetical protein
MAFFSGWILLAWGAAPAVLIIDRLEGKIKILMVRIVRCHPPRLGFFTPSSEIELSVRKSAASRTIDIFVPACGVFGCI